MQDLDSALQWALNWPLPRVGFADGLLLALAGGPAPITSERPSRRVHVALGALGAAGLAGAVILGFRRRGKAA